jgi:hypothetical protein
MRSTIARWCAIGAVGVLSAVAVFHLLWTVSTWPAKNATAWNDAILGGWGSGATIAFCLVVAALLLAAAYVVGARAGVFPRLGPWWGFRAGAWVIAVAFLIRGASIASSDWSATFNHWNLVLYSPICLAVGALTGAVCVLSGRTITRRRPAIER